MQVCLIRSLSASLTVMPCLRTAFAATIKDPSFLAENMQVSLPPLPGDKPQGIIENAFAYSLAIVAKAQALISAVLDR